MVMQLKQLKTLVAIADTGSFHAAAEKMCVTQSAVSMQMKNLEEQLQMELFERTVRPPRLSNTAILMIDKVRDIIALSDDLLNVSPVSSQLTGSIKIGTIPGVSFLLPNTLFDLREKYKHLQVRVSSDYTGELVDMVLNGKLDAAIVSEPEVLDTHLVSRQFLTEPMVVLAPKKFTGLSDEELLISNHFISFNRKAEVSRRIEEELNKRKIDIDPIMELDTLETFQNMILRGLGVGILPVSSVRKHFLNDFYIVPFGSPPLQRTITLIQRKKHHRTLFLDALFNALDKTISKYNRSSKKTSF